MADLDIQLILRLVDKVTQPAAKVLRTLDQVGARSRQAGRAQVEQARAAAGAIQAQNAALRGQAMGLAASGYGFYRLMRPAAQFEQAMARVGAVANASDQELASLTAQARELGATTPWAASQAAQGMQFLAMAGFDVTQTMEAMPGLLDLASASGLDLGRTADITSNILKGFAMEADEMARLGDVLTNTFTSSNVSLSMLGDTMKYVAPNAAAAGVELEQLAAMAGKLGDAGIQGQMAGTSLRAIIQRLAAPSGEAADRLAELGVSVTDAAGNMRDLPTILAEIDAALDQLGSGERLDMVSTIFGLEAASAATVLLDEAGSGALQSYAARLTEMGSASRVAAEMNDTTTGAIRRLSSASEALAITLGNTLLPMLAEMVERALPVIDAVARWTEEHRQLIQTLGWLVAGLFAVQAVVIPLRFAVGGLRLAWLGMTAAMGAGRIALGLAASGLARGAGLVGKLRTALVLATGAMRALGVAALANPLGLVLAGIAAAVFVIYENWDGIVEYFTAKVEAVARAFDDGLLNGVLRLLAEFNPFVLMRDAAEGLFAYLTGWSFDDVTAALRGAFDIDLMQAGIDMITSLGTGIWSVLTGMVERIRTALASIVPQWMVDAWNWAAGGGDAPPAPAMVPVMAPTPAATLGVGGAGAQSNWEGGDISAWLDGTRALGGPVRAGFLYMINEQGQEFFSPDRDGRVVPAGRVAPAGSARPAPRLSIGAINITAAPGQSPRDIARAVTRALEDHARAARFDLHDGGEYAL